MEAGLRKEELRGTLSTPSSSHALDIICTRFLYIGNSHRVDRSMNLPEKAKMSMLIC